VGKVFRDEEEIAASAGPSAEIDSALVGSTFLAVICSPRTPASRWVNEEIRRFRELGHGDRVLICLIEGEPAEAFPPALLEPGADAAPEPLAADFRASSGVGERAVRRLARLKLTRRWYGAALTTW
jgi:MTH538 TIR-like domain (DUF1863)